MKGLRIVILTTLFWFALYLLLAPDTTPSATTEEGAMPTYSEGIIGEWVRVDGGRGSIYFNSVGECSTGVIRSDYQIQGNELRIEAFAEECHIEIVEDQQGLCLKIADHEHLKGQYRKAPVTKRVAPSQPSPQHPTAPPAKKFSGKYRKQ